MAIPSILATEAYNLFKDKWRTQPGENYFGDRWSVAIIKEENKGLATPIGPKEKRTRGYVVVHDKNGTIQEKEYDACSKSWVDNLGKIYPQINAWVYEQTGVNPNLS